MTRDGGYATHMLALTSALALVPDSLDAVESAPLLSGKHDGGAPPAEGTRFPFGGGGRRYSARYWHDQEFATVEAPRGLAREADKSMATLAVAWVLSNPAVTAPIVGASRPEQLADSLAAPEKDGLPADLKARLDELTRHWRLVDADR